MRMRFKENPDAPDAANDPRGDKVMHASLNIGDTVVMLSDGKSDDGPHFRSVMLTLTVASAAEADRYFKSLTEGGGSVVMPLMKTFFSPRFGMVADPFGLTWIVLTH